MGLCQGERLLRRKSKKFRAKSKKFFTIVDLEKAFDLVPKEAICFSLRQKVVPKYLVNILSLFKGCKTVVSIDMELSGSFSVKVVVHQGSALSPLLFIIL